MPWFGLLLEKLLASNGKKLKWSEVDGIVGFEETQRLSIELQEDGRLRCLHFLLGLQPTSDGLQPPTY